MWLSDKQIEHNTQIEESFETSVNDRMKAGTQVHGKNLIMWDKLTCIVNVPN